MHDHKTFFLLRDYIMYTKVERNINIIKNSFRTKIAFIVIFHLVSGKKYYNELTAIDYDMSKLSLNDISRLPLTRTNVFS